MSMVFEKAAELKHRLEKEILSVDSGLLHRFPVDQYMRLLDSYPSTTSYKYVSPAVQDFCHQILQSGDQSLLETYHRLLLVSFVCRAENHPDLLKLPAEVQQMYLQNFEGILRKMEKRPKTGAYLYSAEKFSKNLSICKLTMIPLGAQKVYIGRMSRRFLFQNGISQFWQGTKMVCLHTHGFKPIYRMHTDSRDRDLMKEFNPDGWRRFYLRTAQLLKLNKHVIGLCGSSWFFDPVVPGISPELAYLRELAEEIGAGIFYIGPSEGAVKDATFMAPKREKLYKEGKYKPVIYTMVLPRSALIKWAESQTK